MEKRISIVIINWNGKEHLMDCLPSVLKSTSQTEIEVVVMDNGSTDGSLEYLDSIQVKAVALGSNLGLGRASNIGVEYATGDIVILLNNDIQVTEQFWGPLVQHFASDDVFAVAAKSLLWDGQTIDYAGGIGKFDRFTYRVVNCKGQQAENSSTPEPASYTFYAPGGMTAFDKKKYLALGGFDDLFSPCYYEDVDLSYRAWKRGWKVIYEPASLVYHKHGATISKWGDSRLQGYNWRNRELFIWKNFTGKEVWIKYILGLFIYFPGACVYTRFRNIGYMIEALKRIPQVLERRKVRSQEETVSDAAIYKFFGGQDLSVGSGLSPEGEPRRRPHSKT